MPGKLSPNLRKGQLAEDLGIFFLRTFCAVADVRREDDVGIDALATLLRNEKNLLYAEETFSVQIKAASVKVISYTGKEINWLISQHIPLFILTVDLKTSAFAIYTTNPIYNLFPRGEPKEVKLHLSTPEREHGPLIVKNDVADVFLGPPILVSRLDELHNEGHLGKVYETLKSWIAGEIGQIGFRSLRKARIARWKTWSKPDYFGTVSHGSDKNLARDMQIAEPYVSYLSKHLEYSEFSNHSGIVSAFQTIKKWFESQGVSTDIDVTAKKTAKGK